MCNNNNNKPLVNYRKIAATNGHFQLNCTQRQQHAIDMDTDMVQLPHATVAATATTATTAAIASVVAVKRKSRATPKLQQYSNNSTEKL